MKKLRYEIEWFLVTLTAAILTAVLVVSCAPTHQSFPLASLNSPANPPVQVDNNLPAPQASGTRALAPATIVGNWICDRSEEDCPISKISLMPDGSALADGQIADITIQSKGDDIVHLTLAVPAHDGAAAATLAGDVATSGQVDQISLSGQMYDRAALR